MYKCLVIGLGSMGKRRIRILQGLYPKAQVGGVDAKQERRRDCMEKYNIEVYESLRSGIRDMSPEVAFVCTPPLTHASIIQACLLHGVHVFSELNLVETGYKDNVDLAKRMRKVLFLSSTHLYRRELQYVQQSVKTTTKNLNYLFHVGQYLPDWHPWDVLQDFFVSQKETNGCREFFAIELPWIVQTFGKVKNVQVHCRKVSSLPIQYDDSFFVFLEHEPGHCGVLIVDVVSRDPVRHLEIFGEDIFLMWNGTPESLLKKNISLGRMEKIDAYMGEDVRHEERYANNILENAYESEIKNFFNVIDGKESPRYSFEQDCEILQLIDRIEGMIA